MEIEIISKRSVKRTMNRSGVIIHKENRLKERFKRMMRGTDSKNRKYQKNSFLPRLKKIQPFKS